MIASGPIETVNVIEFGCGNCTHEWTEIKQSHLSIWMLTHTYCPKCGNYATQGKVLK